MKFTTCLVVLTCILGIISCNSTKIGIINCEIPSSQGLKETYYSFPTPRTSHPPGYIYRTSKVNKGHWHETTLELQDSIKLDTFSWVFPESYYDITSDFLAKFLGLNIGEIKGKNRRNYKVKFNIENCLLEGLSGKELNKLIVKENFNFAPNEKYYVITSTIKSKKINISFEEEEYAELNSNIRSQIDSLSGNIKVNKEFNKKIILSKEFDAYHRIFYRSARINSRGMLSNSGESIQLVFEDLITIKE